MTEHNILPSNLASAPVPIPVPVPVTEAAAALTVPVAKGAPPTVAKAASPRPAVSV